jgi:hypothetical protein
MTCTGIDFEGDRIDERSRFGFCEHAVAVLLLPRVQGP